jgi:uncharacterized protein
MVSRRRVDEVGAFLGLLPPWGRDRGDVRGIALVGSWAYQRSRPDSDVDVVLLTDKPDRYANREDWLGSLGGVRLLKTERWGPITERRFALVSGLEIELGVGTPSWASVDPVDDGTRRVVNDGLRSIYDPDGLLAALERACLH